MAAPRTAAFPPRAQKLRGHHEEAGFGVDVTILSTRGGLPMGAEDRLGEL